MGVTGKGNYKRGQEERGEDLLGKETSQKSETRSGRWAETGGEEEQTPHQTRCETETPESSHASASSTSPGEIHQQRCPSYPVQCLC